MSSLCKGSAVRALELLEMLDEAQRPMRLKDFVERTGAPSSSVAELLKSLSKAGYLAFETATRSYLPTQRVAALGSWVPSTLLDGGEVARAMRRLNEACGEMILLGTANDLFVQYCEVTRSTHPIQLVAEAGDQRWLTKSGMGWALLAPESDHAIERIYRRSVQARAFDRHVWKLDQVMKEVAAMRSEGMVLSRNTVHHGGSVIATLLPTSWHGRHISLGIAGPTERIDRDEGSLRRLLQDEIAQFGRRMQMRRPT